MHSAELFAMMVGTGSLALATLIPTPLAPFLSPAKQAARRFLNAPALGFLVATAVIAGIGVALQGWLSERLDVEIPFGTVRWFLMSTELGFWPLLLGWSTSLSAGTLTWLRARSVAQGLHPALPLLAVTAAIWHAW